MSYSPPGGPPHFSPYGYPPMPMYPNPFSQPQAPFPSTTARPNIPRASPPTTPLESPTTTHQAPPSQPAPRPSAAPTTASPGVPYIGARISLISNMNIRYEGTLYTIDPKEATVALQNVRCFGTEGRVSAQDEVTPSPHIYQFIIFRGKDIKDLHVCETPPRFIPPQQPPPPHDPAIVATGTVPSPFGAFQKQEGKDFLTEGDKSQGPIPTTTTTPSTGEPKRDPQQDWAAATAAAAAVREASKPSTDKPGTPGSSSKTIKSTGTRPLSSGAAPFHPAGTAPVASPVQKKGSRSPGLKSPQSTVRSGTSGDGGKVIPGSGGLLGPGQDYDGPGTGSYLRRRVDSGPSALPQGEFDIQSSNARFDKDRFKEQLRQAATTKKGEPGTPGGTEGTTQTAETTSAQPTEERKEGEPKSEPKVGEGEPGEQKEEAPRYDAKKSFYDDISTDRDVAQRRDMIKRDAETFGEGASSRGYGFYRGGGRGRGRGRGRGGYGRGGGGGGGGGGRGGGSNYYNYNNSQPRRQNNNNYGGGSSNPPAQSSSQQPYYRAVPRS